MAYTLKAQSEQFRSGKNILASEIVQYVHGGATLDGSKFPKGIIEVGTLIARNQSTGKYEPFAEGSAGEEEGGGAILPEGFDNFYILNEDHDHDGESDAVTGAVIIEGSVYEAKLPVEVPATFKQANPNIHYVSHK
ncbi:hypothetical protein [Mammaliicoccus sp. JADD-157]|uniref:hypothetical protein n=1 Tax=Mammaliicoccus sp. JADD-157 TaxID=3404818 RepID=UPI003BB4D443